MKALEDQALEDESGYQEDEVIHIDLLSSSYFKIHLRKILNF